MTNKHLAKAKDYIGEGEQFYRKAAEEIIAAQAEGFSNAAIGRELSRGPDWVARLVAWSTNPERASGTPFGGKSENQRKAAAHAKSVLRDASPQQIKQVLADLPPEQIEAVQTVAQDVAWDQSDATEAAGTPLTPTGVAKRRQAKQQSNRRAITVLDALVRLDRADGAIFEAVELLAELDLGGDEQSKVDRRLQRIEQGTELARRSLTSGADWDAALAELQS